MQITAVEPRKKGLSALYIDGEFALKLDTETLLSYRFDVGREIDDEQLHECIQASERKRCKDKALWLISFRDHSRSELLHKLKRDYPDDICGAAVARLEELGLIDDGRFARRYTADLVTLKHLSGRGIRQKLYEKGIDRDLIDEVLGEITVDEEEQIRSIIEKKYARSLSDEKGRRRCANALARLGFGYADIKSVINEYTEIEEFE